MGYKLIGCDLDGSLLSSKKEITKDTIKKIKELEEKGIIFIVATGRPYTGTHRYLKELDNKELVILYNGAIIKSSKNSEIIYQALLNDNDANKIIKRIEEHDGTFIYWKDEVPYVNRIDDYINNYVKLSKVMPKLDNKEYHNITKIIWFSENEKLVKYEKTLFNDLDNVNHFTSEPIYLEFVSKQASKEKALKKVCEYYHIDMKDTIAIGDGANDAMMIKNAGLGVAMGNGNNQAKKYARIITKTNDEEGVLEVLNNYL